MSAGFTYPGCSAVDKASEEGEWVVTYVSEIAHGMVAFKYPADAIDALQGAKTLPNITVLRMDGPTGKVVLRDNRCQ